MDIKPQHSTRFLKRYIVPSDSYALVDRIFELSIVFYNFDTFEEMASYPDCRYLYHIDGPTIAITRRLESLNMVADMLWLDNKPIEKVNLPVTHFHWLDICADTFLMRLSSVIDCLLILTYEVFELEYKPQNCSIKDLKRQKIDSKLTDHLKQVEDDLKSIKHERNIRFHRGIERSHSSCDETFKTVARFNFGGRNIGGKDSHGRRVNLNRYFKEGLVGLQHDFNTSCKALVKCLNPIFELLGEEFENRFHEKFNDPVNGYGAKHGMGKASDEL